MKKSSNVVLARKLPSHYNRPQSLCVLANVVTMASLGFRPPQFSEDAAWLPAWLQHRQAEPFDELVKEPQTPSEQAFKDLAFLQGSIGDRKDANLISRVEGRYNNCHLFLSGEDNSPVSFALSSGNMLHLHLHLSSDGNSQNLPNLQVDTSQAERLESNNVLSMQQVETSAVPGEKTNQSKMDYNAAVVNLFPLSSNPKTSGNVGLQSVTNNKDSGMYYEENSTVRYLRGAGIDDAVELSIAASEALVIHELGKSMSSSEALPAAAVLEVALRVKQARLEGLEDASLSSTEENDEIDFLSDLDESSMADAFEDLGLSVTVPDDQCVCDSIISQVKETPVSENHYGCDDKLKHVEHRAQEVDFDDTSAKKQLEADLDMDRRLTKDFPSESLNCERQKKLSDGFNTSIAASHINPTLHQSIQENSDVLTMAQRVDFPIVDLTSFHPQAFNSSPQAWNSENAEEGKVTYLVPDRFRSRWLGGWMGKEVDDSAHMKLSNTKSISKVFVGETSFLSESADVAPDENSFVQKHETRSRVASQSSIPFEGLGDEINEGILLSQDVVRSSSLSLVDPLCSVVPCSISSESACSMQHQPLHKNDREFDVEKCFSPTSDFGTSVPIFELVHEKGEGAPMINGDDSGATVRRQLTSLRTYSMLLPNRNAFLERGTVYGYRSCPVECNLRVHSSEQNMECIRSSGGRDSTGFLPFRSTSKCTVGRDYENNLGTSLIGDPITVITNEKRNCDEIANGGAELQVHLPEDRSLPLILNHRTRRRLQASRHLVKNSTGEENPECAAAPETLVELQHSKKFQMPLSESKNPHDTQVPMRKRVRFAESEVQLQQNKQLQKLQPANKNCSTLRTFKRLKNSNPRSDSRTQEVKRRLTNCCVKDGNKLVLQGIEFLLTGFSSQKEKEIEGLIRKYGGIVLSDIPSPTPNSRGKRSSRSNRQQLPVVLCIKKLQTTKFLYGCAVNAYMLKVDWLMDSIAAGSVLPPKKYMILSNQADGKCTRIGKPVHRYNHKYIFERVGIMLHGKHSFCTKLANIFKHGGGQVFKTLHRLVQSLDNEKISVGAIVADDKSRASRHLRHCASEQKIPMMPTSWIIDSLHLGKLLPFIENNRSSPLPTVKVMVSQCTYEDEFHHFTVQLRLLSLKSKLENAVKFMSDKTWIEDLNFGSNI